MPEQPQQPLSQADLLRQWKLKRKPTAAGISARPEGTSLRPTSGQQRLWLLQELYPANAFYQYGHCYKFSGPLKADLLEESFRQLINRHEILRTNYYRAEEEVRLQVRPHATFHLEQTDLSLLPPAARDDRARQTADTAVRQPFNLAEDLLLRATLIRLAPEEHWLILSLHHIIGDRASLLVLNPELYQLYTALALQVPVALPSLPVQFPDYAHWKNERPLPASSLQYWTDQLADDPPLSALPFDQPRRAEASYAGATIQHELTAEVSAGVKNLARDLGTTANVVLLAAYQSLHLRYGAPQDLTIGTPVSIRDRKELEHMIGFLNETVVLRSRFTDPGETFRDFVLRVKAQVEEALEHKDISFDHLVNHLQPRRVPGANPLFQNMFVFNTEAPPARLPEGLTVQDEMMDLGVAKFDQTLFATDHGSHFTLALEFARDLFTSTTATRMLTHQAVLLEDAVTRPDTPLRQLRLMPPAEAARVLGTWNATETSLPRPASILELILAAGHATPQATAVVGPDGELTYEELWQRADELAARLLAAGITRQAPVGLYTPRSLHLIVGILGILRAGAAYVPLDPDYPAGRRQHITRDAGITTLVVHPGARQDFQEEAYQIIDIPTTKTGTAFAPPAIAATDLAYLIYTSGSTGKAKGVAINHGNLVHSTTARHAFFSHQPTSFLLLSSFSFDSSVAGIFWTLSQGGQLVLPPARIEQDMAQLAGLITRHAISHTLLLPSLYQLLLEFSAPRALTSLRTVMVAGEACAPTVVKAHFERLPAVELVNEYGPTEGTVWCTAHRLQPTDAAGPVPIGRPIPNVKNYVLDAHQQPVPVGVPGELYVAGPGLAPGYWQRPDLTRERFLTVTLGADAGASQEIRARMYRTGDLVKYRPEGLLDFLGRADQQVKIRGFRVELEEISRQLDGLPAVREAVTTVSTSGPASRLIAYYTLREATPKNELLRALRQVLPEHMVPAVLLELPELPRLPNGKIDRNALPQPTDTAVATDGFVPPETETEKILAETWQKVLKVPAVGLDDNYFDIGGDSIRSIRIIAQARKSGLELAPHHIFTHQTVRELAAVLDREAGERAESNAEASTVVPLRKSGSADPLFCIHAGGGHVFFYQPLARHLPADRPVYAIQPPTLAGAENLPESIAAMAADYLREMRKVRPHGPYHLLGTCFSNAVVLEIAHQLTTAGEEVGSLLFIDSGPTRLEPVARKRFSPVYTMLRILKEGNWKLLRRSLYRYWFYTRQALGVPLEDEQGKTLRLTINGLYKLYSDYNWQPVAQRLTLIRSTQFAGDPGKQFHLDQLTRLAAGGLEVRVTEGNHGELFAPPYVEGLATTVEACLQDTAITVM